MRFGIEANASGVRSVDRNDDRGLSGVNETTPPSVVEFQDLLDFNKKLSAIASAGVPIDLGCSGGSMVSQVHGIQSDVAQQVALGKTADEALDQASIPATYRDSIRRWKRGEDATMVLDPLTQERRLPKLQRAAWTMTRTRLWLLCIVGLIVLSLHHLYARPYWIRMFEELGLDNRWAGLNSPISWFSVALASLLIALLLSPWINRRLGLARIPGGSVSGWIPWLVEGLIGGLVVAAAAFTILGPYVTLVRVLG